MTEVSNNTSHHSNGVNTDDNVHTTVVGINSNLGSGLKRCVD